jgi:hypothetical protein
LIFSTALCNNINEELFCNILRFFPEASKAELLPYSKDLPFYEKPDLEQLENQRDLRAAALAFGLANDFSPFSKEHVFLVLSKLYDIDNYDTYLKSAIYLMDGRHEALTGSLYGDTAGIILALSLLPERGEAVQTLASQLTALLGTKRTINVTENISMFVWAAKAFASVKHTCRKTPLIKAFAALCKTHVKKDDKKYEVLLNSGYTPLGIAYMNALAYAGSVSNTVRIVASFMEEALNSSVELSGQLRNDIRSMFVKYRSIYMGVNGYHSLEAFINNECDVHITRPDIYLWLREITIYADEWLDTEPMDRAIISKLEDSAYYRVLGKWILKNKYSDAEYLKTCVESKEGFLLNPNIDLRVLNVLVQKGGVRIADCGCHIENLVRGVQTKEAFEYCKEHGLADISGNWSRQFLSDEENLEFFAMRSDYIFEHIPHSYISCVVSFLKDETVMRIVSQEDRDRLFEAVNFVDSQDTQSEPKLEWSHVFDGEFESLIDMLGEEQYVSDIRNEFLNYNFGYEKEHLMDILHVSGVILENDVLSWDELKTLLNKFEENTDDTDND